MMPKIIGITGRAGSGKDTLADYLVNVHDAQKYNFALPLKQALNAMFGWTMEQWDDRVWKEDTIPWLGRSPRYLAQTIGTEWGRDLVRPDLWVKLAEQRYLAHRETQPDSPFVIPDCRFDNEALMIKELGGVVVQIRGRATQVETHLSEAGIAQGLIDAWIDNVGTIPEYITRAVETLDYLEAKSGLHKALNCLEDRFP